MTVTTALLIANLFLTTLIGVITLSLVRRVAELSRGGGGSPALPPDAFLTVGEDATDFAATDRDGRSWSFAADALPGPTVMAVFSPSCSLCYGQAGELSSWWKRESHSDNPAARPIALITAEPEQASELAALVDDTIPLLFVPEHSSDFVQRYRVNASPAFYRISADRHIEEVGVRLDMVTEVGVGH